MILETPQLILRSFQDEDIGRLAELMASRDFMRFSLGPYTHEQTQGVLQKFLSWNQAGLPSQFAVIFRGNNELIGYCGFLHQEVDGTTLKSVTDFIPIIGIADLRARRLRL